ncbi:Lrp/AsnC family transcriptional regulator [Corynebacterium sp. UMB0012]|uniref:Lrp/AsnC family transcriptional regulator n=1 Tax=Corynebacterium sp. UMB0012 TaxID=3046344 RepID=UPI00254D91AE|nr:Lrp/AsnC family transcriptional regulator [Corynebacterium sp. UMB0012]MDK7047802.1 Lrp/AsnC family transcriptional regulator [Corynebacterium sp. UMB0012]
MHEGKVNFPREEFSLSEMLSELDKELLKILFQSPRASWEEVASQTDVSASTVSRKIRKLVDSNVVRFVGEIPWRLFSATYPVHAWIRVRGQSPNAVISKLVDLPETQHVASTFGSAPIFTTLHSPNEGALYDAVNAIQDWPGVDSMQVAPVLQCATKASAWRPVIGLNDGVDIQEPVGEGIFERPAREARQFEYDDFDVSNETPPTPREVVALKILQKNGRATASAVAKRTSLSVPAAQATIERLTARGWFRPRIEVSLRALGFETSYVMRLTARPSKIEQLMYQLAKNESCRFVTQNAGEGDIVATGVAKSRRHLSNIVNKEIAVLDGVLSTNTDIIARDWKRYWSLRDAVGRMSNFNPLPPL